MRSYLCRTWALTGRAPAAALSPLRPCREWAGGGMGAPDPLIPFPPLGKYPSRTKLGPHRSTCLPAFFSGMISTPLQNILRREEGGCPPIWSHPRGGSPGGVPLHPLLRGLLPAPGPVAGRSGGGDESRPFRSFNAHSLLGGGESIPLARRHHSPQVPALHFPAFPETPIPIQLREFS